MISRKNPSDPNRPKVKYVTIASCSAVAKLLSIPPVIKSLSKEINDYLKPFLKIDDILYNDNAGGFTFPKLIDLTNELLALTPVESKADVLTSLKLQAASHRINKQNALKYDSGGYIDKTPLQIGNHTEQSRFVKVPEAAVNLKLNLLNEYDKWIDAELEKITAQQSNQPNAQMNSIFMSTYNAEVTPERTNNLLEQLSKIDNNLDKLIYLTNQKSDYLNNLTPQVINASGGIDYPNFAKGTPLFFDRIIQNEIDRVLALEEMKGTKVLRKSKAERTTNPQLSDFFSDAKQYLTIMELLVQRGHCQSETYIWKDEKAGGKSFLIAILKQLHKLKYYKENEQPSLKEYKAIAKNTFGLSLGIDTVKKASPENFDLSFLPVAPN
jgi:hypothetical protein